MKLTKTSFGAGLIAASIAMTFASCDSPHKNQHDEGAKREDTKEVATEHNEAKFDNNQEKDAKFLVAAAESNLKEIQLGQLARDRGISSAVKSLGKDLEGAHSKSQKDLEALAAKKQITVPSTITDGGKGDYKSLADKKAKDFDKAYADEMVKCHKDDIDKFEKAAKDAEDEEIRTWANDMLPKLRAHLDQAINVQKKVEKH